MKNLFITGLVIIVFVASALLINNDFNKLSYNDFHDPIYSELKKSGKIIRAKQMPNSWFVMQRAYPGESIPMDKYLQALDEAKNIGSASANKNAKLSASPWVEAGPTNIPGRITDMAVHPTFKGTIFAASAAGGIFKSTDTGQTWIPLFDNEPSQSMGAVALDPTNPNIIYAGTGEANSSGDSYEGTGIYKSIDGGASWANIGLPESYHIARIVIDPNRPDTIFTAVMGKLFGIDANKGVYRSTDGGATWENKLYIDDTTGCSDIAIDPDRDIIYAGMWFRYRNPTERRVGGYQSGIYKSTDGGENWTLLTNGLPASGYDNGRIGLAVEPTTGTVYAIQADHPGYFMGVWKSTDFGANWTQTNDGDLSSLFSSFGWYFGNIRVAYGDPNTVYVLGVPLFKSDDGGDSWNARDAGIHVDHHALWIDPDDIDHVYAGCDGGMNVTYDGGFNWERLYAMHNTQFYAIAVDYLNPERLYGGAQDNGSMRTMTGAIDDWQRFFGGDGFYCVIDHTNSDIIFCEYQWGNAYRSTNGGYDWDWALNGVDYDNDRHNWNTPIVMDPSNPSKLYYGSHRLWQTTNGGDSWSVISEDLTDGPGPGNLTFGTITTIDVAKTNGNVIYVGTDDGNVQRTVNAGLAWVNISSSLPDRWVTRVTVDPSNDAVCYATFSGYKQSDYLAHIYRTDDYGMSWTPIQGNLPDMPINDVIVDDMFDSTLYVGTDIGVYVTFDLGQTWEELAPGLPQVPVHDLAYHGPNRFLVAGTHGRSMYKATLSCSGLDSDGDGIADECDNCPDDHNPDQTDTDNDNVGDLCDNCSEIANTGQEDDDADDIGNQCDNCPDTANPGQEDNDDDLIGNICDNCPDLFNPLQTNSDNDDLGDDCDNCPDTDNPNQIDTDDDGLGDLCDNCPDDINLLQEDGDFDGVGDICDNCPNDYNPDQADADQNGIGDVCDYICGDVTDEGDINILDVTFLIAYLYNSGEPPVSLLSADPNGDGDINILDINYLIAYLYLNGPEPACL